MLTGRLLPDGCFLMDMGGGTIILQFVIESNEMCGSRSKAPVKNKFSPKGVDSAQRFIYNEVRCSATGG